MTPRDAEVAFVLEGIPGVVAVHRLSGVRGFDYAVHVAGGISQTPAAHYALLRVLSHDECARVHYYSLDLPPSFSGQATLLLLTSREREEAARRVAPVAVRPPLSTSTLRKPFESILFPSDDELALALLVDVDDGLARFIVEDLRRPTLVTTITDPREAAATARRRPFHLVLCTRALAFGPTGFVSILQNEQEGGADRVVVLTTYKEVEETKWLLRDLGARCRVLSMPMDRDDLKLLLAEELLHAPRDPSPPPVVKRPESRRTRVLVIDDDLQTEILVTASQREGKVEIFLARDAMEALTYASSSEIDLVLCSAAMRDGGIPLYRQLWLMRPELKTKFVFIASRTGAPMSLRDPRILQRPITRKVIEELVQKLDSGLSAR